MKLPRFKEVFDTLEDYMMGKEEAVATLSLLKKSFEEDAPQLSMGAYPNIENPKFNQMLQKIRDFYVIQDPAEILINTGTVLNINRQLAKHQRFVKAYMSPKTGYNGLLLVHAVGTGKCHAKNTPIIMFDGSVIKVQDIKIGDELMGDDSTPRKVCSLATGKDDMYDVIPVHGDKYTVNSEHILCLKYSERGKISVVSGHVKATHLDNNTHAFKSKLFNTADEADQYLDAFSENDKINEISIVDYLKLSNSVKKELKGYRKGIDFLEKKVNVDPYTIGLWIGDGSKKGPFKTSDSSDMFLQETVQKHNLVHNQHIPLDFISNSRNNRLKLLAGLIDSNASYTAKDDCFEISLKTERIADDIKYLCNTLGFAAHKNTGSCKYTESKKTGRQI